MKDLRKHFRDISLTQREGTERARVFAALIVGAEAAVNRIHAVGGGYPSKADIDKVAAEIAGEKQAPAGVAVQPEAPRTNWPGEDVEDQI